MFTSTFVRPCLCSSLTSSSIAYQTFPLIQILQLEIENEIELQEKMMAGEFNWTPEGLVLKDP